MGLDWIVEPIVLVAPGFLFILAAVWGMMGGYSWTLWKNVIIGESVILPFAVGAVVGFQWPDKLIGEAGGSMSTSWAGLLDSMIFLVGLAGLVVVTHRALQKKELALVALALISFKIGAFTHLILTGEPLASWFGGGAGG